MTDAERKRLEKEAQGLRAKLKWDHVAEHSKDVWRERIVAIERELRQGQLAAAHGMHLGVGDNE